MDSTDSDIVTPAVSHNLQSTLKASEREATPVSKAEQPAREELIKKHEVGRTERSSRRKPVRQPALTVDEQVFEEVNATPVTPCTSKQLSQTDTSDKVTDTEDLKASSDAAGGDKFIVKTYTCQPINKMDVREALIGTTKKFECQVIGFPPPTIRWFKDNVEITHDPRYNFSHNHEDGVVSMHIETIKLSDAGLYQCRAENCEGYAITAAHLQVKGW